MPLKGEGAALAAGQVLGTIEMLRQLGYVSHESSRAWIDRTAKALGIDAGRQSGGISFTIDVSETE